MAPIANADYYNAYQTTTIGPFLLNDYDPDADAFTMGDTNHPGVVTYPAHGTLYGLTQTDMKSYVPHAGYSGTDSFTYNLCDSLGVCSTATVHLQVHSTPITPPKSPYACCPTDPATEVSLNPYLFYLRWRQADSRTGRKWRGRRNKHVHYGGS